MERVGLKLARKIPQTDETLLTFPWGKLLESEVLQSSRAQAFLRRLQRLSPADRSQCLRQIHGELKYRTKGEYRLLQARSARHHHP